MDPINCSGCGAVVGEMAGNVIVLRHGQEQTTIVAPEQVTRTCRRCGTKNTLVSRPTVGV